MFAQTYVYMVEGCGGTSIFLNKMGQLVGHMRAITPFPMLSSAIFVLRRIQKTSHFKLRKD
jgi:hypothetical protein